MPDGQNSLWQATAPATPLLPELTGTIDAEIAIVGAGYTGLSTALALAERGVAVAVVEANEPGAGASGANGGQVIPGLRHHASDLIAVYGPERGQRLYEFSARDADFTFALIERHGIACEATRAGWIQAAESASAMALSVRRVEAWQSIGAPATVLNADAVASATGAVGYVGGWIHKGGGSLQPLAYARGLAVAAVRAGAQIYAKSPAVQIVRDGAGWRVVTEMGHVSCRRILIATNALTGNLWPGLARTILPVWSFQVATEPLPASAGILPDGPTVSDTRRILHYFRRDVAGRLIMGGKGLLRAPLGPEDFGVQRRMIARLYPGQAHTPLTHWWGGQVAVTLDRFPRLFQLADGVLASFACNGKGVAWCTAIGPVLADALTGAPLEALPLPPVEPLRPIPFHSLKTVYAAAGSAWLRLQDRFAAAPLT